MRLHEVQWKKTVVAVVMAVVSWLDMYAVINWEWYGNIHLVFLDPDRYELFRGSVGSFLAIVLPMYPEIIVAAILAALLSKETGERVTLAVVGLLTFVLATYALLFFLVGTHPPRG